PGLSLSRSQITGNIDATSLSSAIDWTLTLHNATPTLQEARTEVELPKGAVVSRVTLWVNGHPRERAFAPTAQTKRAYQSVVSRRRDPLLVTMSAADRLLVQCFPVPDGGDIKIRLGFKIPLETSDSRNCSLNLPKLLESNFAQPKRH